MVQKAPTPYAQRAPESLLNERSTGNRLLDLLPPDDYHRIVPHCHEVALPLSTVVFRPEDEIHFVYLPTTCIISLLTELADGSGLEVGLVGKEGFAGVSAILGGTETKVGTVQAVGMALKIRAETMREEFNRGGAFQVALLRYLHALMTQISQSAVCNVRHSLPGRLARWLLMYHDRLGKDEFELTQEFMAAMLGVRRSGISETASVLQKKGLIAYRRGHVQILDRKRLEDFACECYPVVRMKYDELVL
jgi:CRP-like cAMP-binding protein